MPLSHHHCKTCDKRILQHKPQIRCSICTRDYHSKCAKLTPSDINSLKSMNLYRSWSCYCCNSAIFPTIFLNTSSTTSATIITKSQTSSTNREYCVTCSKIGNKLEICEMCDCKSHKRCFAGNLGCKKCARNIFPGYDVNVNELFSITGNNNSRFNPFSNDSDLNNIGFTDLFDGGTGDNEDWSVCSQLLDNCKYYELTQIKNRHPAELKVLSLNIRSLKDKISNLIDNIEQFSKFDVLCFNETSCSLDKLPFEGKELELDNFHPPIVQFPSRESSRGGGLAIYLNKSFCSINDYKILTSLSDNSDPAKGEFLFIEITRKNKNIILGNMYRSPSGDPTNFIAELESKLEALKKHKNKHIILVSDSNIDLLKF